MAMGRRGLVSTNSDKGRRLLPFALQYSTNRNAHLLTVNAKRTELFNKFVLLRLASMHMHMHIQIQIATPAVLRARTRQHNRSYDDDDNSYSTS